MIERSVLFLWHLLVGWGGLILGGIYGAIRGFDELLKAKDALLSRFRDYAVFEIIDEPLVLPSPPFMTRLRMESLYSNPRQFGYEPAMIATQLKRKESSVLKSLKRLKKMDKAVERQSG